MAWEELAPKVINDLSRDLNITPQAAAGIVGQLGYESEGLQAINERQPVVPGSRGGFGWAQWTGPRRREFESWAGQQGMDINTPEANYGFLVHELKNTPESRVLEKLQGVQDPQQAGRIFTDTFLRPGIPAYDKRASWTEKAMNAIIPTAQAGEDWWSSAPVVEEPGANAWWQGAPVVEESQAAQQPTPEGGGIWQGFMMGLQDPIDAGAQILRRAVPEGVGQAVDQFGNWLSGMGFPVSPSNGVEGIDRAINERNQQYEQARVAQGRGGMDWARLGGNVAGLAPAFAALPAGGPTLLGRTLVGGVTGAGAGALSPIVGEQNQQDFMGEKVAQAALGGAFGAAAAPIMSGVSRLVSPRASQAGSPVKMLQAEGVQLTPGQALGGALMRTEDKLMSVPLLGDAIRSARTRANEQLNRAVYNRVLEPIGKTTTKIGREAVDDVSSMVSQSYDDVLAKVQFVPDRQFANDILNIKNIARGLPDDAINYLDETIQREVIGPLTKGRSIDGQTFKLIEEQLGNKAKKFLNSTDAYQNQVGEALKEIQESLRQNLARMNPAQAQELRNVNTAFANLTRLQNAAGKIGAQEGVFTPQQLAQAVRSGDMTVRRNQYARGNALMQDLSDAAQSRMSAQIPNSGTTDRALLNLGTLGAGYYNPFIPAGLVAASIPYLPGAVRVATGSIVNRPAGANRLADLLRRLPTGAAGVLAGQQ